jgi:cytochrome c5
MKTAWKAAERAVWFAGVSAGGLAAEATYTQDIKPLFEAKCAGCHGAASPSLPEFGFKLVFDRRRLECDLDAVGSGAAHGKVVAEGHRAGNDHRLKLLLDRRNPGFSNARYDTGIGDAFVARRLEDRDHESVVLEVKLGHDRPRQARPPA